MYFVGGVVNPSRSHDTDAALLLVRANMEASEEDKLPEEEIIAQMSFVMPPLNIVLLLLPDICKVSHLRRNGYDFKRPGEDSASSLRLS